MYFLRKKKKLSPLIIWNQDSGKTTYQYHTKLSSKQERCQLQYFQEAILRILGISPNSNQEKD